MRSPGSKSICLRASSAASLAASSSCSLAHSTRMASASKRLASKAAFNRSVSDAKSSSWCCSCSFSALSARRVADSCAPLVQLGDGPDAAANSELGRARKGLEGLFPVGLPSPHPTSNGGGWRLAVRGVRADLGHRSVSSVISAQPLCAGTETPRTFGMLRVFSR